MSQYAALRLALLSLALLLVLAGLTALAAPTRAAQPVPTSEPSPAAPSAGTPSLPVQTTTAPLELTATPAGPDQAPTTPAATPEPSAAPDQLVTATVEPTLPASRLSLEISKSLRGSDVVQVGQFLTFTIQITNTGGETITVLPLLDEYEPTLLQAFPERASPPPTSSAPGLMRWADLTETFGDLAPGQSVTVTAVFRAIRIEDEVINRARVEAAQGVDGGDSGGAEDDAGGAVRGGQVIVEKQLVESFIRLDTPVISFTLSLRNQGSADIVRAPFVDTYRADLLRFRSASLPPDSHNPATGELRWDDLLADLGLERLRPGQVISFTTVFSVTGPLSDAVVNSADAVNVADEFGNSVTSPRRAEVRIRINNPGGPGSQPTPSATSAPTLEPSPEPSATPEPARRPSRTPTSLPATPAAPAAAPSPSAQAPAITPSPEAPAVTPSASAETPVTTPPAGGAIVGPTTAPAAVPVRLPSTGTAEPRGSQPALLAALLALLVGAALLRVGTRRRP